MIKPTTTLYNSQSDAIPGDISRDLFARKEVRPEDCPWVKVGCLYLSVTITGNESWLPLLARLHQGGYREFSIFSGRHGDVPNQVDSEGTTQGVFDEEHIIEDQAVREKALKRFKDITIEIIDTGAGAKNQKQWLMENATQRFQTNTPVIFAWCYSLFALSEFHRKVVGRELSTPEMTAYMKAQAEELGKSISEIVKKNFAWAMKGEERYALRPGGSVTEPRKAPSQSGDALYAATESPVSFAGESAR